MTKFKSRFSPTPRREEPKLVVTYTDRAKVAGESLSLDDLRDFVAATQDWPGEAEIQTYDSYASVRGLGNPRRVSISATAEEEK